MKLWMVFGLGALYGLVMRVVFGAPMFAHAGNGLASGPMLAVFVVLVPVLIGVYTVHAVRKRPPSLAFALFGPCLLYTSPSPRD